MSGQPVALRYTVAATTAADGSVIAYTPGQVFGRILSVQYVKGNFADTVDWAITGETTGINIWTQENVTASAVVAPRQPTHTQAGAAALYAESGEAVNDYIAVANERIKITITNGGNATSGTFHITVG